MSKSVWLSGTPFTDAAVERFLPVFGPRSWLHAHYYTLMPCAGTISLLRGQISAAPGAGKNRNIAVYKNGVLSDLLAAFGEADTTASDMDDSLAVAAGDRIHLRATANAGVAAAYLRFSMQFDSTTAKQSVLSGLCTNLSQTDTLCMPLSGEGGALNATNKLSSLVMPCSGTIKNLYAWLSAAPGGVFGSFRKRRFTVTLNGVNQTLTKLISGASTTGNDVAHSFAVVAGDYITVECEPIASGATPPDAFNASVSVVLESANDGEFIVPLAGAGGWMDTVDTEYGQVCGGLAQWWATEPPAYCLSQSIRFSRLQVLLGVGALGGDWGFRFRNNGVGTELIVLIEPPDDGGFDTGNVFVENDDLVNSLVVPHDEPIKNTAVLSLLGRVWSRPEGTPLMGANF